MSKETLGDYCHTVWIFGEPYDMWIPMMKTTYGMTEQQIQSKRIKQLEAEGYYVIKLIKTNKNGIPDLIAVHPDGKIIFSEIKKEGGRLSELQKYRLKELEKHGFKTEVYKGDN